MCECRKFSAFVQKITALCVTDVSEITISDAFGQVYMPSSELRDEDNRRGRVYPLSAESCEALRANCDGVSPVMSLKTLLK